MDKAGRGQAGATRAIAAAGLAIAGLGLGFSPWGDRATLAFLDAQWHVLRHFEPRPAPAEIVIVGIDEASAARIAEPRGLWHEPLGKALARIAAARPRAIGLDVVLPDRSYEGTRPGSDRALLLGLVAARQNGPFVATLSIDPNTRAARNIHAPFLAVLREERLAIGLLARDVDGVTRRFSLALPTEDGSFPTFTGRLCKALAARCDDGLLHFALGPGFTYVPLQMVLEAGDLAPLERKFRDRIVLVGDTLPFAERIAVPVNPAAWEPPAPDTPAIVVQALALRTALGNSAPQEGSRPLVVVLVSLAALLAFIAKPSRLALAAVGGAAALFTVSVFVLRSGIAIPLAAPMAVLALLLAMAAWQALSRRFVIRRRG